jgi:hypothetical protein
MVVAGVKGRKRWMAKKRSKRMVAERKGDLAQQIDLNNVGHGKTNCPENEARES